MQGFVVDYENATAGNPVEVMEPFSSDQVPIISTLARNYAISDAWFCSVPSQTWPNRSFVHAGTSNGNADNGDHPNPFDWNVPTIFNVLSDTGIPWTVYSDAVVAHHSLEQCSPSFGISSSTDTSRSSPILNRTVRPAL